MFKETLLGLLNNVKRLSTESNMIYVSSTPCRPRIRSSWPKDPILPHMDPINTSSSNSFEASFSHQVRILLLLGRSAKLSCSWEKVRSLLSRS